MEKASKLDLSDIPARLRDTGRTDVPASADDPVSGTTEAYDVGIFAYLRCDRDGTIVRANATLARWLGLADAAMLLGRPLRSLLHDESRFVHWSSLQQRRLEALDLRLEDERLLAVKCEVRPVPGSANELEVWMVVDLENATIERVARLEAAQTLTAGTVHDVNNVLTVLAGNLFLLTEKVREKPELYETARRARNAAERGNTLLRELLDFDRDSDNETRAISPGEQLRALEPLLARAVGSEFSLTTSIEPAAGAVTASAAQFDSVLINLVINARDALTTGGKILVRIRNARLKDDVAGPLGLKAGDYVCTEVIDDGSGIPQKYLSRVTQPLFTTKAKGRGSGLGLSMVRRFAEQNNGALVIDSTEGKGTEIRIWLPRTYRLAEAAANMTLPLSTLPAGSERILVVTRDHDLGGSIQQTLEALGYAVSVAENFEGLHPAAIKSSPPMIVICERTADGSEVELGKLDALRKANANMRHIALLQIGKDATVEAPDADGFLFRPISVPELAHGVRAVLKD